MISQQRIRKRFDLLNNALEREGEVGEIGLIGGTVMCLVYNAREATKDVDAVSMPASLIRKLVAQIAEDENLPADWLNDVAKGYLHPGFERQMVLEMSHLRVWAPPAQYMLARKCISAR